MITWHSNTDRIHQVCKKDEIFLHRNKCDANQDIFSCLKGVCNRDVSQ